MNKKSAFVIVVGTVPLRVAGTYGGATTAVGSTSSSTPTALAPQPRKVASAFACRDGTGEGTYADADEAEVDEDDVDDVDESLSDPSLTLSTDFLTNVLTSIPTILSKLIRSYWRQRNNVI